MAVGLGGEKGFKNSIQVFFGDAASGVLDFDDDLPVRFIWFRDKTQFTTVGHGFNGIEYQVEQALL